MAKRSRLLPQNLKTKRPADLSEVELAVLQSRQSLVARLGISVQDVLFYLSARNLTKNNVNAVSVRRASDSKTSVIPFRPVVAYNAPRNLLHYNPTTWAEWTLSSGVVGDATGLELTSDNISNKNLSQPTILKPNTKHGLLLNIISSTVIGSGLMTVLSLVPVVTIGRTVGNTKNEFTTLTTGTNLLDIFIGTQTAGNKIKVKDIRVFELTAGSQIEADFTNLTADQLNAKYPMVGANGAPIGALPGVQKDRVCNSFANGDGRYGTVGWGAGAASKSPLNGGCRFTGVGGTSYFFGSAGPDTATLFFTSSATRKYFMRLFVSVPAEVQAASVLSVWNGTTLKNILLTPGYTGWLTAIFTQTDAGQSAIKCYFTLNFIDAATQNGKVLDVKYWSIISMGDSSADPLYNKTAAEMDAYLRTQPGVVLLPDGEYYVPPCGLCAGEQDLDVTAAFGGTSQLYVSDAKSQGKRVYPLNQLMTNGNFAVDSNADGIADGWEINAGITCSVGNGEQQFTPTIQYGQVVKPHVVNVGQVNFAIAEVKTTDNTCNLLLQRLGGAADIETGTTTHTGNGEYQILTSMLRLTAPIGVTARVRTDKVSGFSSITIRKFRVYNLTAIFGAGNEPTETEFAAILTADGNQYWEGTRNVDCSTAFNASQATAASQPKVWDNGLSYCGLGQFDGVDDYMAADLPDITTGPCTWWARVNDAGKFGYIFCRNGIDALAIQYSAHVSLTTGFVRLTLNGTVVSEISRSVNRDFIVVYTWDGATITPYLTTDGVVVSGVPVSFSTALTTRANKFIGARSNAADGSVRLDFFKGTQQEIGIVNKALTADQVQKLWR